MNYLAHARAALDDPYLLAGTAVPDWLNVADRGVRVRSRHAAARVDDPDPCVAAVARGIVRHHADDAWFHETAAFHELCWRFSALIRDVVPDDEGFRPSFLGHVLVEVLLDAALAEERPALLDEYYAALTELSPATVESAVNCMAPRTTARLAPLIPLFRAERFLCDYADDRRLWRRMNQVMRRVRLPQLPEEFCNILPQARAAVRARRAELLPPTR
jgi:hypothetical protein